MPLHKKNKHHSGYDLDVLCKVYPELKSYCFINNYNKLTIDFANPSAVKSLNTALLKAYYGINFWNFPDHNLCPPIPGRVDYIHYLSDLVSTEKQVKVLDLGTGASCIYPLLGQAVYNWDFVAVDVNSDTIKYANNIIKENKLEHKISLRHQKNKDNLLIDIIETDDFFDISMCNPPFYKSEEEALQATTRKLKGLKNENKTVVRNFSGQPDELWYNGGEKAFLHNYIYQSSLYKSNCLWYTSLVSKKDLVAGLQKSLKKMGAKHIKTINMQQGHKQSRILAWSFKAM